MTHSTPLPDKTLLLTSFTTWRADQKSNSSDDLLLEVLKTELSPSLHFLRQLPVDFDLAPQQAIAQLSELRPDAVICCGMAESRLKLSLESRAIVESEAINTNVNLDALTAELMMTEISHDAGQFVCNGLYYAMLKHLQDQGLECSCLFVHVPILQPENLGAIVADFRLILARMTTL